MYNLSDFIV